MKQYWLLVVTAIFLLLMIGLERRGAEQQHAMAAERADVTRQREEMELRSLNVTRETREYEMINDAASSIRKQVEWEADSGRLLQIISDMAAESGIRLSSSRFLADSSTGAIAGGAYQRLKFDINAVGAFAGVVDFIGRIERARQPMIVDSFTMNSDRDGSGRGQVRMQVSCIAPAPSSAPKKTP